MQTGQGMPPNYPAMYDDVMLRVGGLTLRGDLLLVFGICVLCMVALFALLYRTRLGLDQRRAGA